MALNLKTLGTRSLSAVFFVIILVGCTYASYISFLLLFVLVAILALNEYYRLAQKLGAGPYKGWGFVGAILLLKFFAWPYLQVYLGLDIPWLSNLLQVLIFLWPAVVLIKALFSSATNNLLSAMHTLLGLIYAVFPLALLTTIPVAIGEDGLHYSFFKVMGIIFLIWSNDTLAYLGGSLAGKNKMYERISPGKTWEGTAIGALGAIGVGFVLNLGHTYSSPLVWPAIGLLVAVFGTIGDLVESMLKRLAGVKDSGQIMPGHGGALDRFDSLIFVTPFVYALLKVLGGLGA